eukprot:759064-Hanusia_phi.AAC.1
MCSSRSQHGTSSQSCLCLCLALPPRSLRGSLLAKLFPERLVQAKETSSSCGITSFLLHPRLNFVLGLLQARSLAGSRRSRLLFSALNVRPAVAADGSPRPQLPALPPAK